eukprot:1159839-Pelagomonas_calceolata.AAC.17
MGQGRDRAIQAVEQHAVQAQLQCRNGRGRHAGFRAVTTEMGQGRDRAIQAFSNRLKSTLYSPADCRAAEKQEVR